MLEQAGAWQPAIRREPRCRSTVGVRVDPTWLRRMHLPVGRVALTWPPVSSGSWVFFLSISCEEPGEASAAVPQRFHP